ncbi:hypothetical protein GLA29479_4760 [Lysobacter antibioticus]|nr:hypothetical protein GLA29479_4760 [Lysobacter antibioticus]
MNRLQHNHTCVEGPESSASSARFPELHSAMYSENQPAARTGAKIIHRPNQE